jgi:hypothetical protein
MNKHALSVTLEPENLLWLKARVRARKLRSISAALDEVLSVARNASSPPRSVVGTVQLPHGEAGLERGGRELRALFEASLKSGRRAAGQRRRRG